MRKNRSRMLALFAVFVVVFVLAACDGQRAVMTLPAEGAASAIPGPGAATPATPTYLVVARDGLAPGFEDRVVAAGARLVGYFGGAGVALIAAEDERAARSLAAAPDVQSVIPNVMLDFLPGDGVGAAAAALVTDSLGDDESFFTGYQWNMLAIDAPGAWDAGYTGNGVKVAVLDSGIDASHPDLAASVNLAASTSFVPEEPWIDDNSGHGTHVAGIIAAADNAYGTIGVAPGAELIAVKVLTSDGMGALDWVIRGILHAHEAGAKVITMSFGANVQRRGVYDDEGNLLASARDVAEMVNALKQVINYVTANGSVVVTSAGNDAANTTGDAGIVRLPADAGNAISVSATGPVGWGGDPDVDLDLPAFYTNYGAAIDLAAPGGNGDPDPATRPPTWYYDLVFSTYPRTASGTPRWAWMYGTSQAAPHVAGVAALIVQAHGPDITAAGVEAILRGTADDLGKPGRDEWYGHGRVNAAAAVR